MTIFNKTVSTESNGKIYIKTISDLKDPAGPAGPYPIFPNSADPDQMASSTDLDLHCLSFSMWICINNLDQVIWLAGS